MWQKRERAPIHWCPIRALQLAKVENAVRGVEQKRVGVELVDLCPYAFVDEYSNRDSFTAKTWEIAEGVPSAQVVGQHGAGYIVHENAEGTAIEVSSFSPCFVLPEGVSPRGRF